MEAKSRNGKAGSIGISIRHPHTETAGPPPQPAEKPAETTAAAEQWEDYIINERDQHFVLRYAEIIFIEARGHYLLFHLAGAEEIPTLRAKLSDVLSSLPPTLFVQCHRSYAVNLLHIRRFTKNMILVSNGPSLPVSQKYFPCLYNAFTQYYQEA